MSIAILASTTLRILRQLRADPRTVAMIVVVPTVLMVLLYFMFENQPHFPNGTTHFDRIAITMLGILPFALLFLITSIAMLRERRSSRKHVSIELMMITE